MESVPTEVLKAFPLTKITRLEKYGKGSTHSTYIIDASEGIFILQKMDPIIAPIAVDDMRSATEFLAEHGMRTCRVISTKDGASTFESGGAHWRVLTYIEGHSVSGSLLPAQAESAGAIVGAFHNAFQEYRKPFSYRIPTVQTPRRAFNMLLAAKDDCRDPAKTDCNAVANEILEHSQNLELDFSEYPLRPLHGDPKLDNILFEGDIAVALVDLDNLNMYRFPLELGDMLRSFCSRSASKNF
jgi:Ser/Thr protein kinase RdoA (MazF antagonist)